MGCKKKGVARTESAVYLVGLGRDEEAGAVMLGA